MPCQRTYLIVTQLDYRYYSTLLPHVTLFLRNQWHLWRRGRNFEFSSLGIKNAMFYEKKVDWAHKNQTTESPHQYLSQQTRFSFIEKGRQGVGVHAAHISSPLVPPTSRFSATTNTRCIVGFSRPPLVFSISFTLPHVLLLSASTTHTRPRNPSSLTLSGRCRCRCRRICLLQSLGFPEIILAAV